jgi:RHS repeat-associated protein
VTATSVNDLDLSGSLAAVTGDTSGATSITFTLTDPSGNVIGTANPADPYEVVTPLLTDDYGNPQSITGTPTTGPGYDWHGGQQRDAGNLGGVVLMGARAYAPELGRFASVDPVFGGSAGPYDYCNQDPINNVDLGGTVTPPHAEPSTNHDWAKLVLADGGWPISQNNITVILQWMASEHSKINDWYHNDNPLDNGYHCGGGDGTGPCPNLVDAAQDVADNLMITKGAGYGAIVSDLARSASPAVTARAIQASGWSTSHYYVDGHLAWRTSAVPTVTAPASAWGR